MTGPEHYTAAERLLERAPDSDRPELLFQQAQVHATLALAAASALGGPHRDEDDGKRWRSVAEPPKKRSGWWP